MFQKATILSLILLIPTLNLSQSSNINMFGEDTQYVSLGCWKDAIPRAIVTLEDDYAWWFKEDYKSRKNATRKCFDLALYLGYNVFAVQDGGECLSSSSAHQTYNKYGPSSECSLNGNGGQMSSEIYRIEMNECYDRNTWIDGEIVTGQQINNSNGTTSSDSIIECQKKCQSTQQCQFFLYVSVASTTGCVMLETITEKSVFRGGVSGPKYCN